MRPWIYLNALHSHRSMSVDVSAQSHLNFQSLSDPLLIIQAFFFSVFPVLVLSVKVRRHSGALIVFWSAAVAWRQALRLPAYCRVLKVFFNVKTMMPPLKKKDIQIQHTSPEIAATLTSSESLFSCGNICWGLLRFFELAPLAIWLNHGMLS